MSLGKKRSGFQITSVTTDYQPSSPLSPISVERSPSSSPPNGLQSPPTSRFRLVRLDQAPLDGGRRYQKGRWTCVDFYHLEVGAQHRAGAGHSLDSGLPRATPTTPLVLSPGAGAKGQPIPRSHGVPVLSAATERDPTALRSPPPLPTSPPNSAQSDARPGRPVSDVFNERLLLAQSVFNMGDETEQCSMEAIDNKIEQAMDLVKTHLLFAVREEVEALREHIKDLTERNTLLEHENSLLRTLATPQQLSEVSARIQASKKGL